LQTAQHERWLGFFASVIQRAVRSYNARRTLRILKTRHYAAVLLQTALSRVPRSKKALHHNKWLHACSESSIKIQAWCRRVLIRLRRRRTAHTRQVAARNIQRVYRGLLGRRVAAATAKQPTLMAIRLQRFVRGIFGRRRGAKLACSTRSAKRIQCFFRVHLARVAVERRRHRRWAVTKTQSIVRRHQACKVLATLCHRRDSTVKLQSVVRGYFSRRSFRALQMQMFLPAATIQKVWRRYLGARRVAVLRQRQAASIVVMRFWRFAIVRQKQLAALGAVAPKLQRFIRMCQWRDSIRDLHSSNPESAVNGSGRWPLYLDYHIFYGAKGYGFDPTACVEVDAISKFGASISDAINRGSSDGAVAAGVLPTDVIIETSGSPIKSCRDLDRRLQRERPKPVHVRVVRLLERDELANAAVSNMSRYLNILRWPVLQKAALVITRFLQGCARTVQLRRYFKSMVTSCTTKKHELQEQLSLCEDDDDSQVELKHELELVDHVLTDIQHYLQHSQQNDSCIGDNASSSAGSKVVAMQLTFELTRVSITQPLPPSTPHSSCVLLLFHVHVFNR